jgi:hypothetical protein
MAFDRPYKGLPDPFSPDIQPDPTDSAGGTRDESYMNLTCLKAASIIDNNSAIIAANRAIMVKDGTSSIDLRTMVKAKLELLEKGWSAAYEEAKLEYMAGQSRVAGAAVMTPFRLFAQGMYGGGFSNLNSFYEPNRSRQNII